MKTAVTAAALCTVVAAATTTTTTASVHSQPKYTSHRQHYGYRNNNVAATAAAILELRGGSTGGGSGDGGDRPIDTTSVPKARRKRTNKTKKDNNKPFDFDVDDEPSTSSSRREQESSEQTDEMHNQTPTTDPFLESLILEQDLYAILGVAKTATESQLKKAYRKRAVQTHPDKTNGDRRAFDKVSEAYTILSDETKRQLYDRYGKKGLEQHQAGGFPGAGGGRSPEEFFKQFFGQNTHAPRNRNVRYQLEVSLEDMYKGMTQSILIEQPNGRKKVQVHIPKGTASGESIVLSGEVDDYPDATPGDLIFLLQQQSHATFTRKGNDLAMELTIPFHEAIGGVERQITHLDGRKLVLRSARVSNDAESSTSTSSCSSSSSTGSADGGVAAEAPAQWIQTGDVHVLKGEGMPKRDSMCDFGDLYVQFRVEMPKTAWADRLTVEERAQLQQLLEKLEGKKATKSTVGGNYSTTARVMDTAKPSDFGTASGPFRLHQEEHAGPREDHGASRRTFHWSNTGGFGNTHPFFGGTNSGDGRDDGSNVQCQQM